MDFFSSIFGFVLAVGILVTVHEFGHFWVARSLGVRVLKFSIGFGRSIWSWRGSRDGTEYAIAMIPLGGYVRMLDESEDEVPPEETHRAFNRKPLWVRTAVVLAGPMFNFLFAILAYWVVFSFGLEGVRPVVGHVAEGTVAASAGVRAGDRLTAVDGREVRTWGEHRLYMMDRLLDGDALLIEVTPADGSGAREFEVSAGPDRAATLTPNGLEGVLGMRPRLPEIAAAVGSVVEGSPADRAGLEAGDRIVSLDGAALSTWRELVAAVSARPGRATAIVVTRGDRRLDLEVVPETVTSAQGDIGRIGISPLLEEPGDEFVARIELSFLERTARAVENTWVMSALTLKMLWRMLRLEVSTENLSGPITIAQYAGQTVQIGLVPFLTFLAVISVSLGVLNLLPIPVLDGGHLVYYLIELIRGGPVPERVMYWGQQLGILMIAGLMGLAFYNDILRLVS